MTRTLQRCSIRVLAIITGITKVDPKNGWARLIFSQDTVALPIPTALAKIDVFDFRRTLTVAVNTLQIISESNNG